MASVTGVSEDAVTLDLREEIAGKLPPYAAVVTGNTRIEEVWKRDFQHTGPNEFVKYRFTVPVRVLVGGENEAQAQGWAEEFLNRLARDVWVNGVRVMLRPLSARNTDNDSFVRDVYAVTVDIECEYRMNITESELENMTVIL